MERELLELGGLSAACGILVSTAWMAIRPVLPRLLTFLCEMFHHGKEIAQLRRMVARLSRRLDRLQTHRK